MPSQYQVVQYGNLFTGEYLNIGVFAFDFDPNVSEVHNYFLTDWERIRAAFGVDRILEDIVDSWMRTIVNKKQLEDFVKSCNTPYTSLQITQPRASLDEPAELLKWAKKTFLVE
jgi:hypothetical protein